MKTPLSSPFSIRRTIAVRKRQHTLKFHSIAPSFEPFHAFPLPSSFDRCLSLARIPFCWFSFLARARARIQVPAAIARPLQSVVAATRRCLSLFSPLSFFFSLPLSTLLLPLQPPMRRLLTLCIRCNRVLVFRQSAFSKNGCVVEWFFFFFFFFHIQRLDPLDRRFVARTREIRLGRV